MSDLSPSTANPSRDSGRTDAPSQTGSGRRSATGRIPLRLVSGWGTSSGRSLGGLLATACFIILTGGAPAALTPPLLAEPADTPTAASQTAAGAPQSAADASRADADASQANAAVARVKIATDQVYGSVDGTELLCDVYTPATTARLGKRPAVLLIHGGAWSAGSRRTMGSYAMRLARAGIVGIAIDYRLAPTWKFPAQLDDVRTAMLWTVDQAEELAIDPARIGLFGYSAGGHLACLIGTLIDEPLKTQLSTTAWDADEPRLTQLPQPLAICAGGPPCDLTVLPPQNSGLAYFLGGKPAERPEVYVAASPRSHASSGDIPTLYIHGERDAIVPLQSSHSLYQAQRQAGVTSEFLTLEKQGHMVTFLNPRTAEAMVEFFKQRLMPNPPASPQ